MNKLTTRQVMKLLPHRYPFLMIDRVEDFSEDYLVAVKNFTINEPYVQGHFPGTHIMPGVMMVEAMSQASALLGMVHVKNCLSPEDEDKYFAEGYGFLFVSADKIRFRKVVVPGDTMHIHSKLVKRARQLFEFECKIFVDDAVVGDGYLKAVGGISTEDEQDDLDREKIRVSFEYLALPKKESENE